MKRFTKTKRISSLMIALMVASGPMTASYIHADGIAAAGGIEQSATQGDIPLIDIVKMNATQSVALSDISIYPDGKNNRVTFTLTFFNNGYTDMEFINYWVRLQSTGGQSYSVNLLSNDKDKNKVPALSTESFSFYANVGKDVSLADLRFNLIQWDFSVAGYERALGTLQVPADYALETKAGQSRTVWLNQIKTVSRAENMRVTKREKANQISLKFFLKNNDIQPLVLPEMQFKLKTSNGLLYPLKATVLTKDALIQPLEEKEGVLTGTVPSEVSLDGAQLVITKSEAINNSTVTTALAYYELLEKKAEPQNETAEQLFMTDKGTYGAVVNQFYRIPWEDKDIAVIDVTVTNRSNDSLPVPELASYLMIDDSVRVESQNIRMDEMIALKPSQSMNLQIMGKIPYTYDIDQLKVILQEVNKEGEKVSSTDISELAVNTAKTESPTVAVGDSYTTSSKLMDQVAYTISDVQRYSSENESIYVTQVEVKNLEKRQLALSSLVGYFKMADGVTVAATNVTSKGKVPPNGKANLYFYTVVPESYELEGSSLIMGRAVAEGKLVEGETKADAYVNAITFGLPTVANAPQKNLSKIKVGSYALSMNKLKTTIDYKEEQVNFGFNYQLTKDLLQATDPATHRIEIELVDPAGGIKISKIYDLEKGGTALLLGSQNTKISEVQDNLLTDIYKLRKYTINVYDIMQVEGGENNFKRLLATQEFNWYEDYE